MPRPEKRGMLVPIRASQSFNICILKIILPFHLTRKENRRYFSKIYTLWVFL